MAMIAAISMTQERGFHINPRNLRNLLSFFSSSLLGPKICNLFCPSSDVKPFFEHCNCWNTSSTGMRSYMKNKIVTLTNKHLMQYTKMYFYHEIVNLQGRHSHS
ncbi:hypothetical protein LINPERHAP2_LOCUS806 [Linum perenne]